MTFAEYRHIQWYVNLLFWVLELTIFFQVIRTRKAFNPFFYYFFLLTIGMWFFDTNCVLFSQLAIPFTRILQFLYVIVFYFWFNLAFYYFVIFKEKYKKTFLFLLLLHLVLASILVINNYLKNQNLASNIMLLDELMILPLCVYSLFQLNESDKQYKWHVSPNFLFTSAIFIDFLANSILFLAGGVLLIENKELLSILLIIRMFTWFIYCVCFIIGLNLLRKTMLAQNPK